MTIKIIATILLIAAAVAFIKLPAPGIGVRYVVLIWVLTAIGFTIWWIWS